MKEREKEKKRQRESVRQTREKGHQTDSPFFPFGFGGFRLIFAMATQSWWQVWANRAAGKTRQRQQPSHAHVRVSNDLRRERPETTQKNLHTS